MNLRNRKWLAAVLIALLAITATTGAVYAYLSATGDSVTNTFKPEQDENPSVSINAGADTNTYEVSVNVGNPGYAVYVRAAIVVTWRDGEGNVHATALNCPVTYDGNWFEQDGFYYYKSPVSANGISGLSVSCTDESPDGDYKLHVEVISQTIQALGKTDDDSKFAVEDAWGVSVNGVGQLYSGN